MARQVQELIDKIKQEGFQAAEQKSLEIESQTKKQAEEIIQKAEKQAAAILEKAKKEVERMEQGGKTSVIHSARDVLLDLRAQIQDILQKIISQEIKQSLTPEAMAQVIKSIAKDSIASASGTKIEVSLNKKDFDVVSKGIMAKLQAEVKKKIEIKASEGIGAGFTVSFDKGKSSFEFTDKSLTEYLSIYLNPQVSELLKDITK